ncbi:RHS Repeat family protein [Escherichia coli]|nr:RHS Repeat family protein [Escherichia coli]
MFSYDRSGWLTSRTGQMYDHDHYYYDKAGNLLTDEYQGAVPDNRLPGYGRDRYRYNEWGELTERRDQQLEWNAQGQLTRVISSNSETRYQYDALGRRISKATYGRHTDRGERSRTTFVWEGFRLLQETTWQGKRTYLYDAEQPYTPVAAITGRGESRKIWYYHTDLTGTVQEVTALDGTLVWAGYQAGFGENRGDISNSGAYFEQPLRLPGQYFDEETGLHYNLFRYYAPECGRFISQDPISIRGGLNLYRYAPNPIRWIDPLGLWSFYQLIDSSGNVIYNGITDRTVQERVIEHARDGRVFSQVKYVDELGRRVNARNIEGSILDHMKGDLNLENAIRKDGGFYHSYNANNLAEGRKYLSMEEISKILEKGSVTDVDSKGHFKAGGC